MTTKKQVIISILAIASEALLELEASKSNQFQQSLLKPLPPTEIVDPNSSLGNPEHAKARGGFAMQVLKEYGEFPGIDPQEFDLSAKEFLGSLDARESFPTSFVNLCGILARAGDNVRRDDKKYQLSLLLGSTVAMAIVMAAGLGETAPNLVGRLFGEQSLTEIAARVATGIDEGEIESLNQNLFPSINQTILKIILNTKKVANPFIKDGLERFERLVQKKETKGIKSKSVPKEKKSEN